MKKAVIKVGSTQHFVSEGDVLNVDLMSDGSKKVTIPALLVLDDDKVIVGKPETAVKVELAVQEQVKADKVTAIRYKAKKRVNKVHGHRQKLSQVKVTKIA